jgi:GTPase Era involved in 16S rRNA processing
MISRKISKKQGEKLKKEYNIHSFMETSAKNGDNIKKLFIEASKILYTNYYKYDNVNIFNNII